MRKLLFFVPFLALLAAGCGNSTVSGTGSSNNSKTQPQVQSQTPAQNPVNTVNTPTTDKTSNTWTGTLEASNNLSKGNFMLTTSGHTIYINTSRDYSTLLGQKVNVSYQGTTDNFTLGDITSVNTITEPK